MVQSSGACSPIGPVTLDGTVRDHWGTDVIASCAFDAYGAARTAFGGLWIDRSSPKERPGKGYGGRRVQR